MLALGDELGAIGATAKAVAPDFVPNTGLFGGAIDPARMERISSAIGVRRPGTPNDIAQAVRWLASPQPAFVNATVVESTAAGDARTDATWPTPT